MLILTRKRGQDILVGDDIVVTVLGRDKWGSYLIGIDAPKEVSIVRREIAHEFDDEGNRLDAE